MILANRDRQRMQMGKKAGGMLMLFVMPMWMNMMLRTYSWLTILEKNGLLNQLLRFLNMPEINILYTEGAVVLGMVYDFLPFMILPIYSVLVKIDESIIEASQDLGANSVKVFFKIIVPLSIPGIISGFTMVFLPAVTTFYI
jgi:spermidine/putrescine transport system permease protein